ncbi:hypothetical protein SVAN01_00890 [Stagonosporopsis vannaccii]|nr:hypothetical protein SVAN01_00890 [Stagonosporopsis vannaccii]
MVILPSDHRDLVLLTEIQGAWLLTGRQVGSDVMPLARNCFLAANFFCETNTCPPRWSRSLISAAVDGLDGAGISRSERETWAGRWLGGEIRNVAHRSGCVEGAASGSCEQPLSACMIFGGCDVVSSG